MMSSAVREAPTATERMQAEYYAEQRKQLNCLKTTSVHYTLLNYYKRWEGKKIKM